MKLYKRCDCEDARCDHHYWYRFSLHRRDHRGSTHTANRDLAHRISIKRQGQTLESHEKLRKPKTVKLSEHANAYAEWAEKTNRSSLLKDRRVLKGFLETIGDRPLDEITPFHVERWKTLRAKEVSQSSVNRELNVIRGRGRMGPAHRLADENRQALPRRQRAHARAVTRRDQAPARILSAGAWTDCAHDPGEPSTAL